MSLLCNLFHDDISFQLHFISLQHLIAYHSLLNIFSLALKYEFYPAMC